MLFLALFIADIAGEADADVDAAANSYIIFSFYETTKIVKDIYNVSLQWNDKKEMCFKWLTHIL